MRNAEGPRGGTTPFWAAFGQPIHLVLAEANESHTTKTHRRLIQGHPTEGNEADIGFAFCCESFVETQQFCRQPVLYRRLLSSLRQVQRVEDSFSQESGD